MKKLLLLIFLLVPLRAFAQDCTKGQSVTFAQLPTVKYQGTACTVTDATGCTIGSPVTAGGGSTTCQVAWFTPNWVAQSSTAGGSGGGANLAAPGPIGGTTPSTGQFTNLGINTTPGTNNSITWPITGGVVPSSGNVIVNNGNDLWISANSNVNVTAGAANIAQFNGGTGASSFFYSANIGFPQFRTGILTLNNATGAGTFSLQSAANTTTYTLTMPAAAPATSGQVLSATTAGAGSWVSEDWNIASTGLLGALASTAGATLLETCDVAVNSGHLTKLLCTTDLSGTCTTAPTFSTRDVTSTTNGTGTVACGAAAGVVTQATPGLTFAAGDQVCITRTVNGATCTSTDFSVVAHATQP